MELEVFRRGVGAMSGKGRDYGQKLVAILVIFAMLALMGLPLTVILFFAVVVFFVWRAVDRSEQHETRRIFEFYLSAHEILRDDARRWFGFEINEVIASGEAVLASMKDAPPLAHYALGALYQRAGDYEAAIEHLAYVCEDEQSDERHRTQPTTELRRYAAVLRRLEHEPSDGPLTIAAVRSLERARTTQAALLLADARAKLATAPAARITEAHADERHSANAPFDLGSLKSTRASDDTPRPIAPPSQPPPIAEVLRDVYEEEKKTA
jgi:tetratricopeptide (TPR) repeat protein